MNIATLFALIALLISPFLQAQEYRYTHYDVNNGLAGSTVYCMLQDKEGFIWFGTETGISRFDGTHFKNFGTADGLPDNEVMEMFLDSKGRIWMVPFKKAVCYYYKGKIYSNENDSLLRRIKPRSHLLKFAEDKMGNILMMESDQLHVLTDTSVVLINSINGKPILNCVSISQSLDGNFLVYVDETLYEWRGKAFIPLLSPKLSVPTNYLYAALNQYLFVTTTDVSSKRMTNLRDGSTFDVPHFTTQLKIQLIGDSLYVSNNQTGSVIFSVKDRRLVRRFMENKAVSQTFIDNEGNYWFTTLGEGVFRLNSETIASVELRTRDGRKLGAFSLKTNPNEWIIGAGMMHVFKVHFDSSGLIRNELIWDEYKREMSARVTAIETQDSGGYVMGADVIYQSIPISIKDKRGKLILVVKSIFKESPDMFLVATRTNVLRIKMPEAKILDTLWNERATIAYERNDTVYVGTLDGLYMVLNNKSSVFEGKYEPLLRNRISAIKASPDGLLWIATNGAGMVGLRNGKILKKISVKDGLSSNNCRAIWTDTNEIWVGTDKGLNRISLVGDSFVIAKFTVGDGLSSNMINSVARDGHIVVVATPEGINYFDPNRVSFESHSNLVMDDISVSDRHLSPFVRSFTLQHKDNNVRFEYAGISFRSGGEITYRYRLIGLDTSWQFTKENFLNYPTLPSGEYRLELQAINKFGVRSQVLSFQFSVVPLLIERAWFKILMLTALLVASVIFVAWLLRRVRRREMEKNEIRSRIAELEQLAFKSQMNPHFIFNCLNSIQHFVLDKDVEGGNRFISGFSRLIRQTLDISSRREISLEEEIRYLTTYLELEKTRFEGKFNFHITLSEAINPEESYIPPMMLQPFVENSIRHGLRYRSDEEGRILISFSKLNGELICSIEDNGIGRSAALRHKSSTPIEYHSKGMSLIASRVEFLNQHSKHPIGISIDDLNDREGNATGTLVVMKFPLEEAPNNTSHD